MENNLLEAGKIINIHGVRGAVKIEPWADSPAAVAKLPRLFIGGKPMKVLRASVQKDFVLAWLEGVCDAAAAGALRDEIVYADRGDLALPEGSFLVADLVGLAAVDDATGAPLGKVAEILDLPAGAVCVIQGGREILVPARPEFIASADPAAGILRVRLIEGM